MPKAASMRAGAALRRGLELLLFAVLPVVVLVTFLGEAHARGDLGIDMTTGLLPMAEGLRSGISPFESGRYPPLVPVLLVPFTFLPWPEGILVISALGAALGTLWAMGVRDWRCYGAALLWAPVLSGTQTANATLFLVLAAALAWRWRDRAGRSSVAAGLAIGAKLISWPLVVWFAATGRRRHVVGALAVAACTTLGLGAVLWWSLGRADTVGTVDDLVGETTSPSYSAIDVSRMLDSPAWTGVVALAAVMAALVVLCFLAGRRGDDGLSFCLACAACLVGAPNVWLHSFAFLLPVVALQRPRLSGAWLAPLLFVLAPVRDPSGAEVVVAWLLAAALVVWLLSPPFRRPYVNAPA